MTATARTRVVVIGGGYAGQMAAARLTRRLPEAQVTLIDGSAPFVERVRMHQRLAGTHSGLKPRAELLPRGVAFRQAWVSGLDVEARQVWLAGGDGPVAYDYLVCALGSVTDTAQVPGAASAHTLDDPTRLQRLASLARDDAGRGARWTVVGGGLTGIEAATELAEAHPGLQLSLVAGGGLGSGHSARAVAHIRQALERLGVRVVEGVQVAAVQVGALSLSDGERMPADQVIWAAGLVAAPGLARLGLPLAPTGRVQVSPSLQVLGHARVLAVGDAAEVVDSRGVALGMSCAAAMPMGAHSAEVVAALVRGEPPPPFRYASLVRCISLGRRDAVVDRLRPDGSPAGWCLRGAPARWLKELICKMAASTVAWERALGVDLYNWPQRALRGGERPTQTLSAPEAGR